MCLVRFIEDRGRIAYHVPYVIPFKSLQQNLRYFKPESQKLIGDYCVQYLGAVKKYNDAYWQSRYKAMNKLS